MALGRSATLRQNPALLTDTTLLDKICEQCGQPYRVSKPSHVPRRRYCSEDCARRAHKPKMRGELNPNYRHGQNRKAGRDTALRYSPPICMICGFDIAIVTHHVIPLRDGGTNTLDNLAILCPNHHAMADMGLIPQFELQELITRRLQMDELEVTQKEQAPEL